MSRFLAWIIYNDGSIDSRDLRARWQWFMQTVSHIFFWGSASRSEGKYFSSYLTVGCGVEFGRISSLTTSNWKSEVVERKRRVDSNVQTSSRKTSQGVRVEFLFLVVFSNQIRWFHCRMWSSSSRPDRRFVKFRIQPDGLKAVLHWPITITHRRIIPVHFGDHCTRSFSRRFDIAQHRIVFDVDFHDLWNCSSTRKRSIRLSWHTRNPLTVFISVEIGNLMDTGTNTSVDEPFDILFQRILQCSIMTRTTKVQRIVRSLQRRVEIIVLFTDIRHLSNYRWDFSKLWFDVSQRLRRIVALS